MKKFYVLIFALFIFVSSHSQTTVTLNADKDNTIFGNSNTLSNGAGVDLFAGVTGPSGGVRRALIHFDLSAIPAGSVITSATLTMMVDKQAGPGGIALHRLSKNWGEGTSDAPQGEGKGAPATTGDATWDKTFSPSTFWTTPGGDFAATPTATIASVTAGVVSISGASIVSDVQSFVNTPATNFGWLIKGTNEAATNNAQRFVSRNGAVDNVPKLAITYTSNLPVTLKSFLATPSNNNAVLVWKTATEINSKYFQVEHSTNGVNFSTIGRVEGSGNSTLERSYSFTHNNVATGKHYYRLAQYDINGDVKYSQVVLLSFSTAGKLQVKPNPATAFIILSTSSTLQGAAYLIRSVTGQVVKKGILSGQQIDVEQLSSGQYFLSVEPSTGESLQAGFIKK